MKKLYLVGAGIGTALVCATAGYFIGTAQGLTEERVTELALQATGAYMMTYSSTARDTLTTKQLLIVDESMKPRIEMKVIDTGHAAVLLTDGLGNIGAMIGVGQDGTSMFALYDGSGTPRIAISYVLDQIALGLTDGVGNPLLTLSVIDDLPYIKVMDDLGIVRAHVKILPDGSAGLAFFDEDGEDGKITWYAP